MSHPVVLENPPMIKTMWVFSGGIKKSKNAVLSRIFFKIMLVYVIRT